MATKTTSKTQKAKPRSRVKASAVTQRPTYAELRQQLADSAKELQDCKHQLAEALDHQTATSEVLDIISRSPTDVQPVLDAIVGSAAKVCGIDDVVLRLREGNNFVSRAHFGPIPVPADREEISIDEPQHRWMREHGTLHVWSVIELNYPVILRGNVTPYHSVLLGVSPSELLRISKGRIRLRSFV